MLCTCNRVLQNARILILTDNAPTGGGHKRTRNERKRQLHEKETDEMTWGVDEGDVNVKSKEARMRLCYT